MTDDEGNTGYAFRVGHTPGEFVALTFDDERIFTVLDDDLEVIRHVADEALAEVEIHRPTERFWFHVVAVNELVGRIQEYRDYATELGVEAAMPSLYDWSLPIPRELPAYEAKMIYHLSAALLEDYCDPDVQVCDYPNTRALLAHAYEQQDEEIPFYLRDPNDAE